MTWCCQWAKSAFEARQTYGEFLVAGVDPRVGKVVFVDGFHMCHRADYSQVVAAARRAKAVLESEGISNFKLSQFGIVYFCKMCGANLQEHYGDNGGLLRDDAYVRMFHDVD